MSATLDTNWKKQAQEQQKAFKRMLEKANKNKGAQNNYRSFMKQPLSK